MSRSEYKQRQRQQDISDAHTLDGGEDTSTLGFSLGSVKSAPALGGLGLGLNGSGGSGGVRGGRRAVSGDGSGGGAGGGGGGRGTSITAFENVNPFAGAIRVAKAMPTRFAGETGGLSPLSASVESFSGAGPESWSAGEDPEDPHLALVKVSSDLQCASPSLQHAYQ